jgi:hypothetical protein
MLLLAIELGAIVRLLPVLVVEFPLNDGGLFYTIIQDILNADLSLPLYTSYNQANIPIVYPPFAFYLVALLCKFTPITTIDVLHWLPAIISILTIPALYLLARSILKSDRQAGIAALVFALIPRSFIWMIMGGGITRSLGLLFSLLTLYCAHSLFKSKGELRWIVATSIFASLTIVSHLEMGWFAFFSTGILYFFSPKSRKTIYSSFTAAGATLLLTSPWWIFILTRFGLAPIKAAASTGGYSFDFILYPFLNFTEEPFLNIFIVIGMLGIVSTVIDRNYLLLVWLVGIFLLDPRSASTGATIPLSFAVAIALDEFLLPAIQLKAKALKTTAEPLLGEELHNDDDPKSNKKIHRFVSFLFAFFILYGFASALVIPWLENAPLTALTQADQEAMTWINQTTPTDSSFLVLTGDKTWQTDEVSEWFPALTMRVSQGTVQGYEWLPNHKERDERYDELQNCANEDFTCLEEWSDETGWRFTHIYISHIEECCSILRNSLEDSSEYIELYRTSDVVIFKR